MSKQIEKKNDKEIRFNGVQFRKENDELIIEGYAIVWDERTLIGDEEYGFYESIDRHSLDDANMKDVVLRYNHLDSWVTLARTRNKSLELSIDNKGLFIRGKLQNNVQAHIDAYNVVQSKLVDKMSFAFNVTKQSIDRSGKIPHRIVQGIGRLFDVSIVDFPAYEGTSVYARSLDLVDTELKTLENEEHKRSLENEEVLKKQKELELEKLKYSYLLH